MYLVDKRISSDPHEYLPQLPEYFLHCLPENQVILSEYRILQAFLPENGYLKKF